MRTSTDGKARYSVYLLYWYKSTNKVQIETRLLCELALMAKQGTQFTCFTGTNVQILTQSTRHSLSGDSGVRTSTPAGRVRGLSSDGKARYSVYLIYWYKSTNTDVAAMIERTSSDGLNPKQGT